MPHILTLPIPANIIRRVPTHMLFAVRHPSWLYIMFFEALQKRFHVLYAGALPQTYTQRNLIKKKNRITCICGAAIISATTHPYAPICCHIDEWHALISYYTGSATHYIPLTTQLYNIFKMLVIIEILQLSDGSIVCNPECRGW